MIGRGGCDGGLLGHACACARMLVCMLGCLSNLLVAVFKEKTSLLEWQEQGAVLCPSSQPSPPPSPCPDASRLREKHCIQKRALGTFWQKVISRALERRVL